jgi:hypothetical protein
MLNKIKTELTELLLMSRDALHIHVGLGIYVLAMLILRRGPASPVPWLVVLAFELANEALDAVHGQHFDLDITGATRDIGNTMLWPTVALLMARWLVQKRQPTLAGSSDATP